MKKLFGTDGIRGVALNELTCDLAYRIGGAASLVLQKHGYVSHKILVGCDTRISSPILAMSLMSGLCAYGADAQYLGVVSTPCVSYLTVKHGASASVMISASHNPAEYNGIKIFNCEGIKLPDHFEDEIEELSGDLPAPKNIFRIGKASQLYGAAEDYIRYLSSCFNGSLKGIRLAIDCANGSASVTAPRLFSSLGADVTVLNASPDGYNINQRCGSTDIESLKQVVTEKRLDCGIAFDGDADRCIMVDETGNTVDGDAIMAICALDMKSRGALKNNAVVATVMSNFGLIKFCEENGIDILLTAVGDRYVSEKMRSCGYCLGGEQSGHIIFGEHSVTGDGQLSALKALEIICRQKVSLSSAASVMKRYPQALVNVKADDFQKKRFASSVEISEKIDSAAKKLEGNGRVLVRPSGTEPLIRIMAEGPDDITVSEIVKDLADFISKRI